MPNISSAAADEIGKAKNPSVGMGLRLSWIFIFHTGAGQSPLKDIALRFERKLLAKHGKGRKRNHRRFEMLQGLKPSSLLAFFGTLRLRSGQAVEVMPCYKARFDGVFAAA
jgi:hypothetical protein